MADYYKILDISRDSTDAQINQAYRKVASKWHPQRKHGVDLDIAARNFAAAAEAYEVLSNPGLRGYYDRFGEAKFKAGVPGAGVEAWSGWTFNKTPLSVFEHFFGSNNPLGDFVPPDDLFQPPPVPQPAPPIEANLYCSLEELFTGASKKVKITRTRVVDGATLLEERMLSCEVQPGWRENTRLTFPKEGNDAPGCATGDVILVVKELPHPSLTREKNDLVFRSRITLKQALTGFLVDVPVLDGRTLPVAVNEIVHPTYRKIIKGEGMPTARDPKIRGNLVLDFDVTYPKEFTIQQQQKLKELLP